MNTGAQLRDEGIEQVLDNAVHWAHDVEPAFRYWLAVHAPGVFTLEMFRTWALANGLAEPHHPNAWGGLAKRFKGYLEPVGYANSERPQAHARLTRTYTRKTHHHVIQSQSHS